MTYAKLNCLKFKLFDHLTVCKQMTCLIELFVIHSNTCNHLTLWTYVYKSYISVYLFQASTFSFLYSLLSFRPQPFLFSVPFSLLVINLFFSLLPSLFQAPAFSFLCSLLSFRPQPFLFSVPFSLSSLNLFFSLFFSFFQASAFSFLCSLLSFRPQPFLFSVPFSL